MECWSRLEPLDHGLRDLGTMVLVRGLITLALPFIGCGGDDHESRSSYSNVVRRRKVEEEEGGERDRVSSSTCCLSLSLRAYSSDKRVLSNTSFLLLCTKSPVALLRMTLSL